MKDPQHATQRLASAFDGRLGMRPKKLSGASWVASRYGSWLYLPLLLPGPFSLSLLEDSLGIGDLGLESLV